ncbi:MAG: dihydrofolate reductase [Rikenellaceae bacterium]
MINIVVAIAENGIIGGDNTLLWHISEDLKNFKRLTLGHSIIMGRKTYESIGRPLPGRDNIVVSRQDIEIEGCTVVHSIEEAIGMNSSDKEVFVIGGGEIYAESLPLADRLYITRVHRSYEGDTRFPEYDSDMWQLVGSESFEQCDIPFSFEEYRRCATPGQNIYIGEAKRSDIDAIREVALVSFVETYQSFISPEQIDYMLDWMYSVKSLNKQFDEGYRFYILFYCGKAMGYIALHPKENNVIYLERLYLLNSTQGLGLGSVMMDFVCEQAKRLNSEANRIELNVNRNNRAVGYYRHQGFDVATQGDYIIEGTEFIRNDYIMFKEI